MTTLLWILGSTFAMSLLAWVGLITLALQERVLNRLIPYLVAFAAGTLIGGAVFHLLPEGLEGGRYRLQMYVWVAIGFTVLFLTEIMVNWHHCHQYGGAHRDESRKRPVTYLLLIADGIHNFIGGLAIGASFLAGVPVGIITWLVAAAHEIPQELGDFGVLVYGGWTARNALVWNFISALVIIPGGLLAYWGASAMDTTFLLPFAAGNFIYIGASDLIPEIKHNTSILTGLFHFSAFLLGLLLILAVKLMV